jgi:hypothetical protein
VFKIYDVTLLSRAKPVETVPVEGETAAAVLETLADLGFYDGSPAEQFGPDGRAALEAFRGLANFENHSMTVLEDALARGWAASEGTGEDRLVDAIWNGLSRLDRV